MDDRIRVGVPEDERGDRADALVDRAAEQDAAVGRELAGEEEIDLAEPPGESQESGQRPERDSLGEFLPGDAGQGAVAAGDEHDVAGHRLADEDARVGELDRWRCGGIAHDRVEVAQPQYGLAAFRDQGRGRDDGADAGDVGGVEPERLPGLRGRRQPPSVELADRDGDLGPRVARRAVAVVVHAGEMIVADDALGLVVDGAERLRVPQWERGDDGLELLPRRDRPRAVGETPALDAVQVVGAAREVDVPADVGRFLGELVGLDLEFLDQCRIEETGEHGAEQQRAGRDQRG